MRNWNNEEAIKKLIAPDVEKWREQNANLRFLAKGRDRLPSRSELRAIAQLAGYWSEKNEKQFRWSVVLYRYPTNAEVPRLSAGKWRALNERWNYLMKVAFGPYDKGKGRPKKSDEELIAKNPIYDACDEAEQAVMPRLRELFPDQTEAHIKERAAKLVAPDYRVAPSTLEVQLKRSKRGPRRLKEAE